MSDALVLSAAARSSSARRSSGSRRTGSDSAGRTPWPVVLAAAGAWGCRVPPPPRRPSSRESRRSAHRRQSIDHGLSVIDSPSPRRNGSYLGRIRIAWITISVPSFTQNRNHLKQIGGSAWPEVEHLAILLLSDSEGALNCVGEGPAHGLAYPQASGDSKERCRRPAGGPTPIVQGFLLRP